MSTLNLSGILLPFTTPFTKDEDLDTRGLRQNLLHWNQTGIAGYVALGSTGERVNLDEREYLEVLEIARAEVPENLTFIAGVGQQSTRQTINEVRKAARAGADAALVITPSFYRSAITQPALVAHYTAIADASPIPLVLYSMPDLTGITIEPETTAKLSEHPNIIGVKDSSNNVERLKETLRVVKDDFAVMTGNGTVLYDALLAGARGAILAVGCVAPEMCLRIFAQVRQGNMTLAAALQEKLTPLALVVTKRYGIGGLKTAMDLTGLQGGSVRAPLKSPSDEARREIAALLDAVTKENDPVGLAGAL